MAERLAGCAPRPGALAAPPMDCAVDRPSFAERAGEFSHPQLAKESTNPSFSSQPLAGNCNQVVVPAPAPPPLGPGSPSPDGSCGGTSEYTCANATFGACCSSSGWCGDSTAHCSAGCQSKFGYCESGSDTVTTDGSCGSNGKTCKGSGKGECCSSSGYCGDDKGFCGAGCQPLFGTYETSSQNATIDGSCGSNGKTCLGFSKGSCCSSSGDWRRLLWRWLPIRLRNLRRWS